MPKTALLPKGFKALERFVDYWAVPTTQERWERRSQATMPDIVAFYDAMVAKADAALAHLAPLPMHALPKPEERLFQLLLALAQAAMAVEMHDQPRVINSPYPHKVRFVKGHGPYAS